MLYSGHNPLNKACESLYYQIRPSIAPSNGRHLCKIERNRNSLLLHKTRDDEGDHYVSKVLPVRRRALPMGGRPIALSRQLCARLSRESDTPVTA